MVRPCSFALNDVPLIIITSHLSSQKQTCSVSPPSLSPYCKQAPTGISLSWCRVYLYAVFLPLRYPNCLLSALNARGDGTAVSSSEDSTKHASHLYLQSSHTREPDGTHHTFSLAHIRSYTRSGAVRLRCGVRAPADQAVVYFVGTAVGYESEAVFVRSETFYMSEQERMHDTKASCCTSVRKLTDAGSIWMSACEAK